MKKNLRNAFIAVLAMVGLNAYAQTEVTFTAGTEVGTNSEFGNPDKMSKSDVTIESTDASFATPQYRLYKGSKTTFSCTTAKITKIVITETAKAYKNKITGFNSENGWVVDGDAKTATWTGEANSVEVIAANNQVRAGKIEVTIAAADPTAIAAPTISGETTFTEKTTVTLTAEGAKIYYTTNGDVPTEKSGFLYTKPFDLTATTTVKAIAVKDGKTSSVAEKTFTKEEVKVVNSIAEYKQLAAKEKATLKLNDAQVLYTWTTNKGNTSTYVRDNSGAILFYQVGANLELKQNEMLKGEITGTFDLYNKIPELVYAAGLTNLAKVERTAGSDATPKAIKIGEAMDNLCDLVALDKVKFTVEASTDKKGNPVKKFYVVDGDKKVQIYNGFHLDAYKDMAFDAETEYNVVGIVASVYKEVPSINIIKVEKNTTEGINTVATETINANAPMYNLAGQRVGKNYKGVVIQNGKKFINK